MLGQLKNEALTLAKSLQGDNQSYTAAKDLLTQAFASTTSQKFETINKLSNLSLPYNGNCYEFVGSLKLIRQSFDNLKITVDDILQFFVWRAMPISLQNQFISITNNNKPSLDEIEKNIFSAIERFSSIKKQPDKPNEVISYAANIDYNPQKNCLVFCSVIIVRIRILFTNTQSILLRLLSLIASRP